MPETLGKAVLFFRHPDGRTNVDEFIEGESDLDPWLRAENVLRASGDDFPDSISVIGGNDRAKDLAASRRMQEWGLEWTPEDAANLRTGNRSPS